MTHTGRKNIGRWEGTRHRRMGDVEMERKQKKGGEKLTQIGDRKEGGIKTKEEKNTGIQLRGQKKDKRIKRERKNQTDRQDKKWMLGDRKLG